MTEPQAAAGRRPANLALEVVGLDCVDCAATLERVVANLDGVLQARVHFTTGRLEARFDGRSATSAAIAAAVEAAGYGTRVPGAATTGAAGPRIVRGRRDAMTLAAGVTLAAALVARLAGAAGAQQVFLAMTIVLAGQGVARAAVTAVRANRALDMNVLMTIAAAGAVLIGEWAEGATALFLFGLGTMLEGYTADRARDAIRRLTALSPRLAVVRRAGGDVQVPVESLAVGDMVVVRPGERLPVDGLVVRGTSAVNEAPLTGESLPVDKRPDDAVFAGTINGPGALEVEATRPATDTQLARIVHLVEEAQASRAPSQRLVDRFARVYTPLVIALAVAIAVGMPALTGEAFVPWFHRALILLVIACPCALVLSTPVTIVSALSSAARQGVLIKGGAHLEAVGALRAMALDKTGTLTQGRPIVTDVVVLDGRAADEVLALAAAVEARSEHPLARAIVHEARHRALHVPPAIEFTALPGRGARSLVNGVPVTVGTRATLARPETLTDSAATEMARLEGEGKTAMLVAVNGVPIGLVAVADRLRPEAADAVSGLRQAGIRHVVMLTGDNAVTARAIGDRLGVTDVRSGLLPADKAAAVRDLVLVHGGAGMVGDGVNDAPALAAATVGIATAGGPQIGSDAALETADIVLQTGDLSRLAYLVRLGRRARRTVTVNIAFSLAVKAAFLALAVAGAATLWMAVLADVGTSLVVVLNGMRLLRPERAP